MRMLWYLTSALLISVLSFVSLPASAQSWSQYPAMNKPRFEASVVQYNDDIYVFNGFGPGIKHEPSIEKFSAATKTWQTVGQTSVSLGNAVTHNGLIRNGNTVWFIGGRIGDHPGAVSSMVWLYNLDTGTWRQGPSLPTPVASGGAALINNRIHWFGGVDPQANCDENHHFVYNLNAPDDGWQDITGTAAMPVARNHFATVVYGGLIYAIGGQFGHDNCPGKNGADSNLVHAFNPVTNQWVQKASMPAPQSHVEPSTFVYRNGIYVIGGQTGGKDVYRYDPAQDKWETVLQLPEPLVAPVARVIDNRLLIMSGYSLLTNSISSRTRHTDMIPLQLQVDNQPVANTTRNTPANAVSNGTNPTLDKGQGLVSIEAEYFVENDKTPSHKWVVTNRSGASNNAAIVTTPDVGALNVTDANSPGTNYHAYFDRPGTWYLWVRGWGDTNALGEGQSDSVHAGINGSLASDADKIDHFPASWNWTNSTRDGVRASVQIAQPGINAIDLWMREDGLAVDKIVLTTDPDYVPSGMGPAQNVGAVNDQSGSTDTGQSATDNDGGPSDGNPANGDNNNTDAGAGSNASYQSINGLVSIEVEQFDEKLPGAGTQWVSGSRSNASNGASMVTASDTGAIRYDSVDTPLMNYSVYFAEAGTYTVWLRGWGDTVRSEGQSDSAHVGIDGKLDSAKALQSFPANWSWSRERRSGGHTTLTVPAPGIHTVNLWMREDGLELDKLVLAKSATYQPTGQGPQATRTTSGSDHASGNSDSVNNNGQDNHPADNGSAQGSTGGTDTQTEPETGTPAQPIAGVQENSAGLIVIEAEQFTTRSGGANHEWIIGSRAGASGGKSMITTPDSGALQQDSNDSPSMTYPVSFSQPGTYFVWVRGWGDTVANEGQSDSIHIGINGTLNSAKAVQSFPAGWHWSNQKRGGGVATLTVPSAGQHTINVWMREDGFEFDKLVLTRSSSFAPQGYNAPVTMGSDSTNNGSTGSSASNNHDSRTLSANRNWSRVVTSDGSKVQARHETGGVVFNGKLYVMGGRWRKSTDVYDPVTRSWKRRAAPPMELHHFQPVVFDNRIWAIGAFTGGYPDETPVKDIYSYTPATDRWKKEGTVPSNRRRGSAAAVVHDGYIYLVGGNTHGHRAGAVKWLDRYNPRTGSWNVLADAPEARDHATAVVANGKLVIAAGRRSAFPNTFGDMVSETDVYDFSSQRWSSGAHIPTRRAGTMSVNVGNEMVVIGGEAGGVNHARDKVEAYNVVTNRWRSLRPLITGRHSGAAAVLNNQVHVVTGSEHLGGSPKSTEHEVLTIDP